MTDFIAEEISRSETYRVLSKCFLKPGAWLLESDSDNEQAPNHRLGDLFTSVQGLEGIDPVLVDYARLFVGPFQLLAPPYGSLYLEDKNQVLGESTIDVRRRYAEEGLVIGEKEVHDHIAIELDFMYFLVFKEHECLRESDTAAAESFLRKQQSFLKIHLGAWVDAFAQNIEKGAETDFYKALAGALRSFIAAEMTHLEDIDALIKRAALELESNSVL